MPGIRVTAVKRTDKIPVLLEFTFFSETDRQQINICDPSVHTCVPVSLVVNAIEKEQGEGDVGAPSRGGLLFYIGCAGKASVRWWHLSRDLKEVSLWLLEETEQVMLTSKCAQHILKITGRPLWLEREADVVRHRSRKGMRWGDPDCMDLVKPLEVDEQSHMIPWKDLWNPGNEESEGGLESLPLWITAISGPRNLLHPFSILS